MYTFGRFMVGFVAVFHILVLILEMFLWQSVGLRVFGMTPEQAKTTATLAMNQGLYNGFLAAGLIWTFLIDDRDWSRTISLFFLGCVIVAGIFGAATAKWSIILSQGLPAMIGFAVVWMSGRE